MADYGEWTLKGATLTEATAQKEYGVDRDFIVQGIRSGKLEYREASMFGNPCLRILRSQLEQYIAAQLGPQHLGSQKVQTELRQIKKRLGVSSASKRHLNHAKRRSKPSSPNKLRSAGYSRGLRAAKRSRWRSLP
jgi:hypothetical protein